MRSIDPKKVQFDKQGNFKAVLLFEGTNNDPCKNPSAISEMAYAYDWVEKDFKGNMLPDRSVATLQIENMQIKKLGGVVPEEKRIYRGRRFQECESKYQKRLVDDESCGQVVSLTRGSGLHGVCKALLTGEDWDVILGEQYDFLRGVINAVKASRQHEFNVSRIHLYVFGFSRGAYQANLFVNGITKFGVNLSRKDFVDAIRNTPKKGLKSQVDIPSIRYVGLIDTVSATARAPKDWNDVGVAESVHKFRHALAINEYRPDFKACFLDCQIAGSKQQKLFIGSHSDVGWAYNGIGRDWWGFGAPQTATCGLGKIVYSWLLEPVKEELGFEPVGHGCLGKMFAYDYLVLLLCAPFCIHDSTREFWTGKTLRGMSIRDFGRRLTKQDFHESVAKVLKLVDDCVRDSEKKSLLKKSFRCTSGGESLLQWSEQALNEFRNLFASTHFTLEGLAKKVGGAQGRTQKDELDYVKRVAPQIYGLKTIGDKLSRRKNLSAQDLTVLKSSAPEVYERAALLQKIKGTYRR